MRGQKVAMAAVALFLTCAVLASCSSDGGDGKSEQGAITKNAEASSFDLDEPVKIVMAIQAEGSSDPNRIPDFEDGLRLAVDDMNASGGIGGHDVELEIVDTPSTPPEASVRSLELAQGKNPTAVIGFPSSAQVTAVASIVAKGTLPVINLSGEPTFALSGESGSRSLFTARALNTASAAASARFVLDEFKPKKVGILAVQTSYGTDSAKVIEEMMADAGVDVVATREMAVNTQDLTGEVLAMRDADVVFNFGFPNQIALALTTMAQNGMDVPTIGGASTPPVFTQELADPAATSKLYATVDCLPSGDKRDYVQDWAKRFEKKYGYPASLQSGQSYDAANFLFQAIIAAKSADNDAVISSMEKLQMKNPVCGLEKSSKDNILNRSQVIISYADSDPSIVAEYKDPLAG